MINFIKKHKYPVIGITVFAIFMVVLLVLFIKLVYPDSSKNSYGNRLNGIEQVTIQNETVEKAKKSIQNDQVVGVDYNLEGRLVNFIVEVKEGTDLVTAKSFADTLITNFSDKQKEYYDFQVFLINSNKESDGYPAIGYRHKTSVNFKWTGN